MKVLLLTTNYPPVQGGVSRYYEGLVEASRGDLGVAGVHFGEGPPTASNAWLGRIAQVKWAYRLTRQVDSSVAILAGQPVLALGPILANRPFALALHGGEWNGIPGGSRLLKLLMRASVQILLNSRATRDEFVPASLHNKCCVITPGLPRFAEALLAEDVRDEPVVQDQEWLGVVCVSRPSPRKGIARLAQAVQICRRQGVDVRLTVVGQLGQEAREWTGASGIRFAGFLSDDELAAEYSAAQVFALVPERIAGGEGWEGFGIVYLEAAAAGLFIVATDTGGVVEAISPESAVLLTEDCTEEEIAEAILLARERVREGSPSDAAARLWARSNLWGTKTGDVERLITSLTGNDEQAVS